MKREGLLLIVTAIFPVAVILPLACSDDPIGPRPEPPELTEWVWQNPLPQGNNLRAVCFTDANTGTVAGDDGRILRTTNGGTTWVSQTSGTVWSLYGVSFTDANAGTVVGHKGTILRTTDGGARWVSQTSGTDNWLHAVCFTDANTGTAVGDGGTILRATTGGD